GMTTEKYETKQMKEKLADFFAKKDIAGAKAYFLESLEKRPDVLMEASDITGELKVSMQVVAVCELEEQELGQSVIDRIQDFDGLMHYFNRLNDVINSCKMGHLQEEDITFLKEAQVSEIAIEASARLFCTEEAELARVVADVKKVAGCS
ncbi:MAG: capsular biosynthesis protein, partial [Lachnospiraceae bacterium]|nr:capsular biosynthesis protein [Lachnospiraceae bacterium]